MPTWTSALLSSHLLHQHSRKFYVLVARLGVFLSAKKSINLVLNLKPTINEFGMILRHLLEIHEGKSVDEVPQPGAVTLGKSKL